MKKMIIHALALLMAGIFSAQLIASDPDAVVGTWLVPKGDAKIGIFKCGKKYCGKITWLKKPDDVDDKNPDPKKRKDKLLGRIIMWGFVYSDGEWEGGRIYDPESGDTYKCKMWLEGGALNVKGYIGVSLLGRAETWKRVK